MDHTVRVDSYAFRRIRVFLILALCLTLAASSYVKGQGGSLTYVYDELGRLVAVVDPTGDTARYSYDAGGNLLSISRFSSSVVSILHFSPNKGPVGTAVTIYGTAFSTTASLNTVTFNGVTAVVTAATATQILTTVPAGATTGSIAITTPAGSATSSAPFTVGNADAPTITEFVPAIGVAGTTLTITGTNFDSTPGNNRVKINATHAQISSATATTITTSVPALTASGRVGVSTAAGSAVSVADFIVPPPPYTANDLAYTGRMIFGEIKTISIATGNKIGIVLFDGSAGQRLSLGISNSTMGWTQVSVLNPNGTALISPSWTNGSAFLDTRVLPATGTYTIVVDPENANTGSMTLQLYDVPPDVTGTIMPNGDPVTRTTTVPGQNARATFSGTAGQRMSLQLSNVTTGWTQISIINPDGTALLSPSWINGSGFFDPKVLPATGIYTILADPENANVGSVTMQLYDVPADVTGTITPGGAAVTVTTTTAGQNAILTFSGTAGQRVSLQMSNSTFAGCIAVYDTIKKPDGTTLASTYLCSATGYIDTVVLPVTGSYTILIDPQGTNIGSQTLLLNDVPADVTGTITPGGAGVTVTTTTAGQNAILTFSGTAGQQVSLQMSNSTFTGCIAVYDTIKKPDGTTLASTYLCGATGNIDTVVLPVTGSYTILIDPEGSKTGSQTLLLNDVLTDVTGTITPGGAAVTVTTTTAGQNAVLTFSGTAGQRVSLQMSNSTFTGCIAVYDTIKKPDGTTLASTYLCSATGYIDTVVLPVTGSYTILIDPQGTNTGSQTLLLNDVPADVTGTITPGGAAVTVTTTTAGQNAILTFSGTAGQRVSLQMSNSTFTGCIAVYDTIKKPDGTTLASTYLCSATGYIDTVVLPVTGSYTILIDPEGTNIGSQTLLLNDVPADVTGTITPGGAGVTVTTTTAGQNAILTFSGTAGQRVSLQMSNSTFTGCIAVYDTIKKPDGTTLASTYLCSATGYIDTVVLPVTGSYTILIDPQGINTGSQTLQLNDVPADVTGTITPGGAAVTVTTTTAGQNAILTFSGTAGQRVSLQMSNSTFTGCIAVYDKIKKPDGTTLASTYLCGATGNIDTVVLPVTGSYTILIDPEGSKTGSQTLLLNDVPG